MKNTSLDFTHENENLSATIIDTYLDVKPAAIEVFQNENIFVREIQVMVLGPSQPGYKEYYTIYETYIDSGSIDYYYFAVPTVSEELQVEISIGWFTNETKPLVDADSNKEDGLLSDEVLIDVNGKRETFVTGCWHFPHGNMEGWWRVDEFYESSIELENMRWSYLPLAKYDK